MQEARTLRQRGAEQGDFSHPVNSFLDPEKSDLRIPGSLPSSSSLSSPVVGSLLTRGQVMAFPVHLIEEVASRGEAENRSRKSRSRREA